MRETYKMKRWMSICLIVVLFLSGMCFEKVKTDPEFGVSKTVTSGVFQSLQNPTDSQDMCSSEQLGDSMLRSTGEVLRRTASGQRNRTFSNLSSFVKLGVAAGGASDNIFRSRAMNAAGAIVTCESVIIAYIHQQDGSKG